MILFIIFYLIIIPLSTLFHEVGHALGLVLVSKERAVVYLGLDNESNKENFRIGRVHFHIKWAFFGFCGYKNENISLKPYQQVSVSVGGPLISLVIALVTYGITFIGIEGLLYSFVHGIALFNFWMFLCTIVPIRYPWWWKPYNGRTSDGYKMLQAIKSMKNWKGAEK